MGWMPGMYHKREAVLLAITEKIQGETFIREEVHTDTESGAARVAYLKNVKGCNITNYTTELVVVFTRT
jgi:hypothetical protein